MRTLPRVVLKCESLSKGFEHSLEIPHDHYLSMKPFLSFLPSPFHDSASDNSQEFTTYYDSYNNTQKNINNRLRSLNVDTRNNSIPQSTGLL